MNKGYKLFRVSRQNKGKLYPLFVNANKEVPIGIWVDAECGERKENGKVKSKLGDLKFRSGWHLCADPLCTHIGIKGKSGNIEFLNPQYVWCECEFSSDINYQSIVNELGRNKNGKIIPKNACMEMPPKNGYYMYKTSPNMTGEWIIAGSIKINRILTDEEVENILKERGLVGLPRYGGNINLNEFGFAV